MEMPENESITHHSKPDLYLDGEERFGRITSCLYSRFSGMSVWKPYRHIIDFVKVRKPMHILDVGCGPGDVLLHLAGEMPDASLYGIDPSVPMVKIAEKRAAKLGLTTRVTVAEGSSRKIDLPGNYDMIISSFSFHHWIEKRQSLEYLLQKLTDDGTLAIFEADYDGLYGRLPLIRKHALSKRYAEELTFPGYDTTIEHSGDRRLLIVSFRRKNENRDA